jgi:phosphatidate cytidylyltransferase
MQRVLTALVLIVVVLAVLFKAPFWLFALVIGAVALLAAYEYLGLVAAYQFQPMRALTLLLIALSIGNSFLSVKLRTMQLAPPRSQGWRLLLEPAFQYQMIYSLSVILVALAPLILLVAAMRKQDLRIALPSAACSYMTLPYIGITLSFLIPLRERLMNGPLAIFYLLIVVWIGDIFAYYVGRFFGRHFMAPRISPKKTWEGALASLVFSTIAGTLLLRFNAPIADFAGTHGLVQHTSVLFGLPHSLPNVVWISILASAGINIASQLGDLVESMIKRGANVKDSGVILPGHGGILDRIDALLLAIPVLWYYASFGLIHF